jgi:hypothetical protein
MSLPTLKEFEAMCKEQDFHYWYSDDHRIYTKGRDKANELQKVVREGGKDYLNIMIKEMEAQGA